MFRFLYDGTRIKDTDTPDSLEMEDNDSIDVMIERKCLLRSFQCLFELTEVLYCVEVGGC